MNQFLILAFLFFIGSLCGWFLELVFRRFYASDNKNRKWINPGFCKGPYLPIYGTGLCILYLLASLEKNFLFFSTNVNRILLFFVMAVCMTLMEYIAGIVLLKAMNLRLWDYSSEWKNVQGIICPKFSLIWAMMGAVYYFCIHSHILEALDWLSNNLAFSFVIGMFFGVFLIDTVYSSKLLLRLKAFAEENQVVVHFENLKTYIFHAHQEQKIKYQFFNPFEAEKPLSESLMELKEKFEKAKSKQNKV